MNYLIGSLVALLLVFTANVGQYLNNQKTFGSVAIGGEYQGTTTDATWTSLSPKTLATGSGTLGSVNITTVGTGSLTLYDATTTNVNLRTGNKATSTITLTNFQVTTGAGEFHFDRVFFNGLIAVWVGTNNASTSITYR